MKKIIPLILVAVVAIFLLAGCDAMLESIYPNQTAGKNTIDVTVNELYTYPQPIVVEVFDSAGNYVASTSFYTIYANGSYYYNDVAFTRLKDDTYTLYAWIDINQDKAWNAGEPGSSQYASVAGAMTSYPVFYLPY